MQRIKNYGIALIIIVVIALLAGFFIALDAKRTETVSQKEKTGTTTIEVKEDVFLDTPESIVIEEVPIEDTSITIPNLVRSITIPDFYPPDAAVMVRNKIQASQEALEKDPTSFGAWLDLSGLYANIHDWEGVQEINEFLSVTNPTNFVSFLNLGTLYHLHIKDFSESEKNFKQAIINNPTNAISYASFHELYRDSYKQDTSRAVDILKEGLTAIPNDLNLLVQLASYYEGKGDTKNAKEHYNKAKTEALRVGNTELATRIDEALQEL